MNARGLALMAALSSAPACNLYWASSGTSRVTVVMMSSFGRTEAFSLSEAGTCRQTGSGVRPVHVLECPLGTRVDFAVEGNLTGIRTRKAGVLVTQARQMVVVDYDGDAVDTVVPMGSNPRRLHVTADYCAGSLVWLDLRLISSDRLTARLMPDHCTFSTGNLPSGEYVAELMPDGALKGTAALVLERKGMRDKDTEVFLSFAKPPRAETR